MAKRDLKEKVLSSLTFIVMAIIVARGVYNLGPEWQRRDELRRKNAELQRKIDSKNREIARLIENRERFQTDNDFVESIARHNNRLYPGEIVFCFENSPKKK